ncbi:MAG: hypothetical protein JXB07_04050 [Anaerolineae bacterium]|nr:hypothetical protein [Anaerolineae bacterium]
MAGFMYIPFWRAGGWEEITYRTQLYFTPLGRASSRLGIYLFENGGKPWANKTFQAEIDQQAGEMMTNQDGMLDIRVGPGQTLRIEINVIEHEYGTGEVHLLGGNEPVLLLARGEIEVFATETGGGGFELSTSEISITGCNPVLLEPGK